VSSCSRLHYNIYMLLSLTIARAICTRHLSGGETLCSHRRFSEQNGRRTWPPRNYYIGWHRFFYLPLLSFNPLLQVVAPRRIIIARANPSTFYGQYIFENHRETLRCSSALTACCYSFPVGRRVSRFSVFNFYDSRNKSSVNSDK